jgi:diaminopimelate epimerase
MRFSKWHALGNSYLVVERADAGALVPDQVRRLCDVDTGIGSDGLLEVVTRSGARAEILIWNPDGSVAEMSGNGVRIAARWLSEAIGADRVTIVTAGRAIDATMLGGPDVLTDVGDVVVGEPETIDADGEVELTTASVGNPHAVIRIDSATRNDLLRIGPAVETHVRFPQRTNVQLVRVDGPNDLSVLVWERGAGETSSSGSSSVAAAAVAVSRGWCVSPVTVHLPGGDLFVELDGLRATLTGPAEQICRGDVATTGL